MTDEIKNPFVRKEHIILGIIILLQLIACIWVFVYQKDIYYTDEYYSYGISNSDRYPFMFTSDGEDTVEYLWYTGDDFKYYLRTNRDTAFRYDNVWYNSGKDTIPPLYYTLLHTLCSFNPGHFSWYDAFVIDLVCLIVTQIFVYLLAAEVTHSKWVALLTVAFWGFSLGGISCFTYLRMYALLQMLCMIAAWQAARIHTLERFRWRDAVGACLVTFLGAMTHHNYLVFAFFCTLFSCMFLLFQRSFRRLFAYGLSVTAGVLLSFAAFPAVIDQMTKGMGLWDVEPDPVRSAPFFQALIKEALLGDMVVNAELYIPVVCVLMGIVSISVPLLYLFRDKPIVRRFFAWLKQLPKQIWQHISDPHIMHPGCMILLLMTFAYFWVIASMVNFWNVIYNGIRYYYVLLPGLVIIPLGLVGLLLRKSKTNIRAAAFSLCAVGMACILFLQHLNDRPVFVVKAPENNQTAEIAECVQDQDCIILLQMFCNVQCMSEMLENADTVLTVRYQPKVLRSENCLAQMQKIFEKNQQFYLFLNDAEFYKEDDFDELLIEENVVTYIEDLSGCTAEYCGDSWTQNLRMIVYHFTPAGSGSE